MPPTFEPDSITVALAAVASRGAIAQKNFFFFFLKKKKSCCSPLRGAAAAVIRHESSERPDGNLARRPRRRGLLP